MITLRTVVFLSCLFLLCGLVCASDAPDSQWLVPRELVAGTELQILWQHNLPIDKLEEVWRLCVYDERLYVLSNRNYLTCLNRNDGQVLFSSYIAPAGLPVVGLEFYAGQLLTVVGNKLVEVSAEFDTERNNMRAVYGITCPVVRNSSHYYIGGTDKRVHVLRCDNMVQMFEVAAENDSAIKSILANEDFIVFGTDAGNILSVAADRPTKLWQFDLSGAVASTLVTDAHSVFAASDDTNIYKLDISNGELIWKYQTEGILKSSPQVGASTVYQHVSEVGLTALDKNTGEFLWQVPGGIALLAEKQHRAYTLTRTGILVVMDNAKQKERYRVDFGASLKYAANNEDSKLYLCDDRGRMAALQPKD